MKYLVKNTYLLALLLLSVISCQKVIDIDLKDSEPMYVIEGEVLEGDSLHTVKITKSVKFGEVNSFPNVSGAVVTITDDLGNIEVLKEVTSGKYVTSDFKIKGVVGRTYSLKVQVDGKTFESTSKIPTKVNLEDILMIDNNFAGNGAKTPVPVRLDPAGEQNNYLFDLYIKRKKEQEKGWVRDSAVLVLDDIWSDGVLTQQPIFGTIQFFEPGDSIKLTMNCIDRNVYKYFYSLFLNNPQGGAATPANPISNITGGCLGYFSAQTKQTIVKLVE